MISDEFILGDDLERAPCGKCLLKNLANDLLSRLIARIASLRVVASVRLGTLPVGTSSEARNLIRSDRARTSQGSGSRGNLEGPSRRIVET